MTSNMTLHDVTATLAPITLHEIGAAELMDRVDRKFVIPARTLPGLLEACGADYRVLEIDGRRTHRYSTRYFDTRDLRMYNEHHANRLPRMKVRVREYVDSGTRYAEVKRRTNTGRTNKSRVRLTDGTDATRDAFTRAAGENTPLIEGNDLQFVVSVDYTRITLVRASASERVTIDLDVSMTSPDDNVRYASLAFVEVKQAEVGPSPFVTALTKADVREGSISKYCLGVAQLVGHAKSNRFKAAIARLERAEAKGEVA